MAAAQGSNRELPPGAVNWVEATNGSGRIEVVSFSDPEAKPSLSASSGTPVAESEVKVENIKGRMMISVNPSTPGKRIDLRLRLPERSRLRLTTEEGEIRVEGNFATIEARSNTGTLAFDIPTAEIQYDLNWTASRPRIVSDIALSEVKERSAGRFAIKGRHRDEDNDAISEGSEPEKPGEAGRIELKAITQRGIVLLNVPPNEVTADLRERPLTESAKAMIRSGDSVLMDAIRRAAPKFFGDYMRSLPPRKIEPELGRIGENSSVRGALKKATVQVIDNFNRAVTGLEARDFSAAEGPNPVEILAVKPVEAPVNLVLLLDVSGSVDDYVTFIRKAARSFVDTVDKNDRISIVIFNDDVKVLAGFTTDKQRLSESLDTFDAGGATAYYDALGYTLSESLRPLKNERTAIVVLTDGDDNRSFLAFDSLAGAIEESGALIYPLYVPSSLIAASAASGFNDIDPLRNRHLTLTSKADAEGRELARISGGKYYPISQLSQIQAAYEDIVVQLRTAYDITYRSAPNNGQPVRLRVRVGKPNTFVQVGPIVPVTP